MKGQINWLGLAVLSLSLIFGLIAFSQDAGAGEHGERHKHKGCDKEKEIRAGEMPMRLHRTKGKGIGMVKHILSEANELELTEQQKKELKGIEENYLYPLIRKEADLKISEIKLRDMLSDPNFDPVKVKEAVKALKDMELEMASTSIDALSGVRKVLGEEKFKEVLGLVPEPRRGPKITKPVTPPTKGG